MGGKPGKRGYIFFKDVFYEPKALAAAIPLNAPKQPMLLMPSRCIVLFNPRASMTFEEIYGFSNLIERFTQGRGSCIRKIQGLVP